MTHRTAARLAAASLVFVALGVLASACSNDLKTTTVEDIQKGRVVDDNAAYSALVAYNFAQAQVAKNAQAALSNPDAIALATKIATDSNADLVRLYGTADVNSATGAAAPEGGLGSSAGLQLVSNSLTDHANADATSDIGSIADDASFADTEVARYTALVAFAQSLVDAKPDAGISLSNEQLRTEIQTELTTWQADLDAATQLQTTLAGDAGSGT